MLHVLAWVFVIWALLLPLRFYIRHKQRQARRGVAPTYVVVQAPPGAQRLMGCTCGEVGRTGAHYRGCPWGRPITMESGPARLPGYVRFGEVPK